MKDDNGGWIRVSEIERRFGRRWKLLAVTMAAMVVLLAVMVIAHYVGHA